MTKITKEKIKSLCIPQSYDKGVNYRQEGRVQQVDLVGDRATAKVQGSQLYEVRLDLSRKDFGARCSCPYDWGGYCKHIVATLLRLGEMDLQDLKTSSEEREERISEVLRKADGEKLKEFLKKEFTRNPDLKKRFLVNFGNSSEENTVEDYKKQVRELYSEVAGAGGIIQYDEHIDFSTFHDLAQDHSERGNFREAAKIYRAVSEVIAEEMDRTDDSTGYYGEEFEWAIAHYGGVLAEGDLESETKKTYIDYLFERYMQNDPDYFQEYYEETLEELCSEESDYRYWKELLSPHLPERLPEKEESGINWERREAIRLLSMQVHILKNLNQREALEDLFESTYRDEGEFCLQYVKWLVETDRKEKAIEIAEEELENLGRHYSRKLRKILVELYENTSSEKHKQNLKELYIDKPREEYYQQLKSRCTDREWRELTEKITSELSGESLIEFLLLEDDREEAFDLVLETESLWKLRKYLEEVGDYDSETYFEVYSDLLADYLGGDTGRSHYRKVIGHLQELKKLGLTERLREYVEFLKKENANRPAFQDEISSFKVN